MMQADTTASFWPVMWIGWMLKDDSILFENITFGSLAERLTITGPLSKVISSVCVDAERLAGLGLPSALHVTTDSLPSCCSLQ